MIVNIFLPCRSSSVRIKRKNIKPFCGKKFGLFELKISQLILVKNINNIIVSTNDNLIINYLNKKKFKKVILDIRNNNLCRISTSTDDLIKYVPTVIKNGHILWTHVTSPFFDNKKYDLAIKLYKKNIKKYDSLMGTTRVKDFIYNKTKPINFNRNKEKWPRTQTLKELFLINNSIFLSSRENYIKYNDRIGKKPFYMVTSKIDSFDIDWPEDFTIAENIYESFYKKT